jgi:poly(A) polymerase/tRNA nucleotidyltransferase (CCA-adding enzyme)
MKFTIPPEVIEVSNTLTKNGFEAYLVGGAVRDLVMGKPATDWDFTTNALPDEILALFGDRAFYNNTFGTVGVTPINESFEPHEITTFRHESSYTDYRRPDSIEWGKTLEGDLTRRDFTINAMAINLEKDQEIIDPFDGQKDIKSKIIRTVGDPFERFGEDALRLMRAVRIAGQLGFTIESKTHQAMVEQATLINRIAKERVREELMKILSSADPYHGILLLKETQLLSQILPELEKCFGVDQKSPQRHHIYDVGTHLLMALKNCKSTNPITRFATLIHDIGKPQTVRKLESGVITFYNHEMVSTKIAERIADRLRFSNEEKDQLTRLVRWHQFTVDEHQTDSAIRRFIRNVGVENLDEMLALRVADRLGGGARETSWRLEEFKARLAEVQLQPFSIKDLKINGQDVMQELSLTPGPEVGIILNKLFADVEEKKVENEKEALLRQIKLY